MPVPESHDPCDVSDNCLSIISLGSWTCIIKERKYKHVIQLATLSHHIKMDWMYDIQDGENEGGFRLWTHKTNYSYAQDVLEGMKMVVP